MNRHVDIPTMKPGTAQYLVVRSLAHKKTIAQILFDLADADAESHGFKTTPVPQKKASPAPETDPDPKKAA